MNVVEGQVITNEQEDIFLLVLGKSERGSADQWVCLVLGDFYDNLSAHPHAAGSIKPFSIRVDMPWKRVAP